ncbi:MAG: sigma-54-dependent Fis family transcriptional regulator [Burkholderiales bacterium]|nr:sigma-54-dependent Fis family transcriptional regulator [Burkholderiales bacterium]
MAAGILIIEDELTLAKNIATYLKRGGYETCVASTGEDGLAQFEAFRPEAVLLDYALPGISGIEVLKRIKTLDAGIPVILMTGHGSELVAVEAMKAGAYDYLIKPVILSDLKLRLEKVLGEEQRGEELTYHRRKAAADASLDQLIGDSAPMAALKAAIRQLLAAESGITDAEMPAVLITGETGTGKELVARALHFGGPRRDAPFVELNCSTIPGDLLEAELFGYERGAFTDAKQRKLGLIEAAAGGTLFLDEIGDIDSRVQVKLLKLLEDKTVRRLGSVREQHANIRIVTATNRDLEQLVHEGHFRADLLFRLRIVHFELPPLRARGSDVQALAAHYLDLHRRRYRKPLLRVSAEAEQAMLRYRWPGNVRELRNLLEQAVIMATGTTIEAADLRLTSTLGAPPGRPVAASEAAAAEPGSGSSSGLNLADVERELLVRALGQAGGNVSQAARLLGVSRDTVRYRMEKHGLKPLE